MIAVASGRGGSGKTTVAVALGDLLARSGRRVALVDLDTQGSMATYLGLSRATDPLNEAPREAHGMRIFAGGIPLSQANAEQISDHIARATVDADVVLVDCPPDVTSPSHTALLEYPANLFLAVARLEPGTPPPLQTLTGLATAHNVPFLVLPNVEASGRANSLGVLIALQALYSGEQVMPNGASVSQLLKGIPDAQWAPSSIAKRVPVTTLRPKAPITGAFASVAADLVNWGLV